MPECTSCGATEFQNIDGEYYCTTCQTLSQVNELETLCICADSEDLSF